VLRNMGIRNPQVVALLLVGTLSLFLAGCDGSDSAFVEDPTVSFFSDGTKVPQDGVLTLGLLLDKPAPISFSVGLFSIDDDEEFEVPGKVRISSGQSAAVFEVRASETAEIGEDQLKIQMLAGNDYIVGEPSSVDIAVAAAQLPSVALEGGEQSVVQDGSVAFAVSRSVDAEEIEVNILPSPNSDGFNIPSSITFAAGATQATFEVSATAEDGSVDISILPPEGYVLSEPFSATITIE